MIEYQILSAKNDDNNAIIKDLIDKKHEFEIKLKELQDKCRTAYLDYNDTLNIAIQEAERR